MQEQSILALVLKFLMNPIARIETWDFLEFVVICKRDYKTQILARKKLIQICKNRFQQKMYIDILKFLCIIFRNPQFFASAGKNDQKKKHLFQLLSIL